MKAAQLELAQTMRDGFMQGGYDEQARLIDYLLKAAKRKVKTENRKVKSCPNCDSMTALVDETLAEIARNERKNIC